MDYLKKIPYTQKAWSILNPHYLDYIAALAGYSPPNRSEGFIYCELGCGYGLTANLLAASNPRARFVAIDLMPEHIRHAQQTASKAGLGNINFISGDICRLDTNSLPDFDFITLHGLFSWVPDQVRSAIIDFIGSKLKPNGRVMMSYNALPGWHEINPIRDLLRTAADQHHGGAIIRVKHAVDTLRRMYLENHPTITSSIFVRDWVAQLLEKDHRYVAHEYLGECDSFAFADINARMQPLGMHYGGDAFLSRNYPELDLGPHVSAEIGALSSVIEQQTVFDRYANTTFRMDVYVKSSKAPDRRDRGKALGEFRFALLRPAHQVIREREFQSRKISATTPTHDKVIAALAERPLTAKEIAQKDPLLSEASVLAALQELALVSQITPSPENPVADEQTSRFNQTVLFEQRSNPTEVQLASSELGTWVPVDPASLLFLAAHRLHRSPKQPRQETKKLDFLSTAARMMTERGWFLRNPDGTKMVSKEALRNALQTQFSETERSIPFFRSMGWWDE